MNPIRTLLVDDHQMVRQGLVFFLSTQEDIDVVGQAADGEEAVRLARALSPDVILMDLKLPGMNGLDALEIIRGEQPEIEVLVLTSFIDDKKVVTALERGATGYLMKDVDPAELARGIRAAAHGEVYLHPEAARRLAQTLRPAPGSQNEPLPDVLTDRELDVIRLVARGLSNQDIAEELVISPKTVKAHVSSVLQKLNLESRVQAALYALRHDIVSLDET